MTNQQFTISRNILKGLTRAAGKKDVRYYLNGVCFECGPKGSFAVATDGSILAAYRINADAAVGGPECRYIVPTADIDRIPKKGDGDILLTIRGDKNARVADLFDADNNMTLHTDLIDGKYPNWWQVLPSTITDQAGQFDPELLHRFTMMAKDFGRKASPLFRIHHNGPNSAATIDIPGFPEFVGVIMPLISREEWEPAWHHPELKDTV